MNILSRLLPLCLLVLATPLAAQDQTISEVTVSPQALRGHQQLRAQASKAPDLADNELSDSIALSFQLQAAAETTVLICDLRGNIVRTLEEKAAQNSGTRSLTWDGLDQDGDPCSGGVYLPVIQAQTARTGTVTHMGGEAEWGQEVLAEDMRRNAEGLSFTVPRRAYGRVRIGLPDGGPIYRTLAPWRLFEPGSYVLPWDGKDTTGRVDLNDRSKLYLVFDGFALPDNAIVIDGPVRLPQKKYPSFPLHPPTSAQPSFYALYTEPLLPEPDFTLKFRNKKGWFGQPKFRGKVRFTLNLQDQATAANLSETMVFIDGVFAAEYPTTTDQATITFDAAKVPAGEHLFTVNLITSDDRAASWSQTVLFR